MEKDLASLVLGIVALFFTFLFGQNAFLSIVCALISILFAILSIRSGGRKAYYLGGLGASILAIVIFIISQIS